MSEPDMQDDQEGDDHEKGATFDMYHFFSRKDVILICLLILAMLLYVIYSFFSGASAV